MFILTFRSSSHMMHINLGCSEQEKNWDTSWCEMVEQTAGWGFCQQPLCDVTGVDFQHVVRFKTRRLCFVLFLFFVFHLWRCINIVGCCNKTITVVQLEDCFSILYTVCYHFQVIVLTNKVRFRSAWKRSHQSAQKGRQQPQKKNKAGKKNPCLLTREVSVAEGQGASPPANPALILASSSPARLYQ